MIDLTSDQFITAWAQRWANGARDDAAPPALIYALRDDLTVILRYASLIEELGATVPTLLKMLELIHQQGGTLHIGAPKETGASRHPDAWFVGLEWSREAPDSDMAGAASYSHTMPTLLQGLREVGAEAQLGMWAHRLPTKQRFPEPEDATPQIEEGADHV
jgi:hypothetical protein